MKTLVEVVTLAAAHLEQKGIANARRQAEEVIADALGIKRLEIYLQHDKPLTEEELNLCRQSVARRAAGEPAAYIAGQVEFMDCLLRVSPDVLIPRPETELLVEQVQAKRGVLWDLCTGSGCIGIALKKRFPDLQVILSDICPKALAIARENAVSNQVAVEIREGDLFAPFAGEKADFVICNPPYIPEVEYEALDPEVRVEPKKALVGGGDGLDFYRRLAEGLPGHLNPAAKVWFEVGYNQGEQIKDIFTASCWKKAVFSKDWSGHDRFFSLEFE